MGFDKSKVMRAAEKSLAQGKIPSAIKEYQNIVEHDSEDFSALNMLGDLFIRVGNEDEAIACFTRVAEHYREEGFALKAIAMYKKMDRLKPGSIEIAAKLAPLYELQGLLMDARTQYLLIADAYTRGGHAGKALEVLRKIADLDPNNTDIRLKLADGYERENFRTDATDAFAHAGAQFYGRGAYDQALDAYRHALKLNPFDHAGLSGLTSTHIALGTADEAAELLERAIETQPEDAELYSLLAHAYVAAEDAKAAERATVALVLHEPSSFRRYVEVMRLYLKGDDLESTVRLMIGSVEQLLSSGEESTVDELLNEILARNPEEMIALGLLVRLHSWQHDSVKLRSALERLAEAAQAAGLEDEERKALSQLLRLVPDDTRYRERLHELGVTDFEPDSFEDLPGNMREEEVPTFESFVSMSEDEVVAQADEPAQFEWNAVPSDVVSPDASASFSELGDGSADFGGAGIHSSEPVGYQEFNFNSNSSGHDSPLVNRHESAPAVSTERREAALRQELERVDFYMAQGYQDIALNTLDMLEQQFGAHAEIAGRRAKLASLPPESAVSIEFPVEAPVFQAPNAKSAAFNSPPTLTARAPQPDVQAAPARPNIDPGLAAIFDEFRTAVEEEDAPVDGDFETHYNLGLAYKEMELLDEAVEAFQVAASLVAPRDGTPRYLQCCNLLGHIFIKKEMGRLAVMWLQHGLDAPGHTEDEYQALRYEMGLAHEQMGDLDKAIDVFSEVYGVNVSYRGVADKLRELQSLKTINQVPSS